MKTLVPGADTNAIRSECHGRHGIARWRVTLATVLSCLTPPGRLSTAEWVARARRAVRRRFRPTPAEPAGPQPRWKARLDTPANGGVLSRGLNIVGGWGIHEWRQMQGVVVTVNGRPHAFVTEFYERADVARRWPDFATVGTAGWSTMLDLEGYEGGEVVVSAHALLEPKRRGRGPGAGLGPVLRIGTARCSVDSDARPSGLPTGHFHQEPFVLSGFARVSGTVQSAEDIATVEVSMDGRPVGLARTTPVPTGSARGGKTILTTRFASVVEVPADATSVSLSATLTSMSGKTHEISPWHPEVRAPTRSPRPDRGPPGPRAPSWPGSARGAAGRAAGSGANGSRGHARPGTGRRPALPARAAPPPAAPRRAVRARPAHGPAC